LRQSIEHAPLGHHIRNASDLGDFAFVHQCHRLQRFDRNAFQQHLAATKRSCASFLDLYTSPTTTTTTDWQHSVRSKSNGVQPRYSSVHCAYTEFDILDAKMTQQWQ
jgi:hypothetical protein